MFNGRSVVTPWRIQSPPSPKAQFLLFFVGGILFDEDDDRRRLNSARLQVLRTGCCQWPVGIVI
jgi:hypothetical protein